jgi:hypothetical protein
MDRLCRDAGVEKYISSKVGESGMGWLIGDVGDKGLRGRRGIRVEFVRDRGWGGGVSGKGTAEGGDVDVDCALDLLLAGEDTVEAERDLPLPMDDALVADDLVDAREDAEEALVDDAADEAIDRDGDVGSESGDMGDRGCDAMEDFGDREMLSTALTLRMGESLGSLSDILDEQCWAWKSICREMAGEVCCGFRSGQRAPRLRLGRTPVRQGRVRSRRSVWTVACMHSQMDHSEELSMMILPTRV